MDGSGRIEKYKILETWEGRCDCGGNLMKSFGGVGWGMEGATQRGMRSMRSSRDERSGDCVIETGHT